MPSTSREQIIPPEMIRPFSKAGPRQNTTRNTRKMSSAIVTDTPEKKKLEEQEVTLIRLTIVLAEVKKKVVRRKTNSKTKKNNDDCVVCNKAYENSDQDCFKCKICSGWAHESCGIKGEFNFFCKTCFLF
ncbi:unnamed protein product [Euphydryas editha]|uniref:Zinc finger PHD-type domain-containing protein n=1 Tax=Euphydryas editha TaxID=104508 RepID=A0AAU9U1V9_EUPED|nr:unnamed protein product [Euphydryas editha]